VEQTNLQEIFSVISRGQLYAMVLKFYFLTVLDLGTYGSGS